MWIFYHTAQGLVQSFLVNYYGKGIKEWEGRHTGIYERGNAIPWDTNKYRRPTPQGSPG